MQHLVVLDPQACFDHVLGCLDVSRVKLQD